MTELPIEILARGVYVHNGRLLVCHNRKKDNYFLPGGHVEFGESAGYALKREIKEEMGLSCTLGAFLGVVEHAFRYRGKKVCEINLVYEMKFKNLLSSAPAPSKEKKLEFIWMPLRQIARSKFEPAVVRKSLTQWLRASAPLILTAPALKK
ncbi:MAG TPA: ADP-ribose pyrophosphatase [Verrucomicrobia bacterium]|nr:MAG: hypothetical protein A2X46_02560 [Lentisphaerae bacterium GWF2_57_35]HBA85524.1 ADP-ribose pyrophosphatase [Verrucomicrobiota bacterium]